jgi:hypothetical protein
MPNHVTNNLVCKSDKTIGQLLKPFIFERVEDGETNHYFDFNKVVPMPPCIVESIKYADISYITKERTPEEKAQEDKNKEDLKNTCIQETGFDGWYEWCRAKWNTKWNSYNNITLEDNFNEIENISTYCFQTAWCPPTNVIRELAKATGETIELYYADEGYDFFGRTTFSPDGEVDECYSSDEVEDIDPSSDIYAYCDLDFYLENLQDNEEEED